VLREAVALIVILSASEGSAFQTADVEESAPARTLKIDGLDYAFRVPQHVKAGRTTITFVNRGKQFHEFNLNLLAPGATPEQVMAALKAKKPVRNLVEASAGVLFAIPGEASGGAITTDLLPGRTYMAICIFRDSATAPPHHQLGMFVVIKPEGSAPAAEPLRADTIVATDYAFTYPRTLAAGLHRFVFVNRGSRRHEVNMERLKTGVTMSKLMQVENADGDVLPLFDSLIGVLHSYSRQSPVGALEVNLLPGREYAIECTFQDDEKAPPHVKLGMFGSIHVTAAKP
jgi:hypothetical protein